MGMPISTYAVLHALAHAGHDYETRIARDVLRPFNLFAFIVHDPNLHDSFDRTLNSLFDRLDFETGEKLLFLALVDPPAIWTRHASSRRYYAEVNEWQMRELLDPDRAVRSNDQAITAIALASSLGIPEDKLPVIVVSPDFSSQNFIWIRTCSEHVREQLRTLGYIAERTGRTFIGEDPSHEHYGQILDRIKEARLDLCDGRGQKSLESTLAEALTDVLSFIVLGNPRDYWVRDRATDRVVAAVRKLRDRLSSEKTRFDAEDSEELDNLCVTISSLLAQLNSNSRLTEEAFIPINGMFLESDSNRVLRTAHRVYDLFVSGDSDVSIKRLTDGMPDYSPVIICLAKVFEREINLSIVHWIRKELGISLPRFFDKPQPGVTARFQSKQGGRPVDFNAARGQRWLPPALGQSEFACREISQSKTPEYFRRRWLNSNWKLLLTRWNEIKVIRNRAAHDELVDVQSLLMMKTALEDLAQKRIFEILYRMKTSYRGGVLAG